MVCGDISINTTHKDDSKIHDFAKSNVLHYDASNSKTFDHTSISNTPSPSTTPTKFKPNKLTKPTTSSISETKHQH